MELKGKVSIGQPSDGSGSGSGYGDGYGYGYGSGYGDGSGSGYGSGYGYGDGYGSGSGYGDGYGYGNGSGSGYGYGDGSGSGYGYGYGYGDGYGSGSGYGYGYGSGSGYGEPILRAYVDHPLVQQAVAGGDGVSLAIWRSNSAGLPANGGHSKSPAKAGLVEQITGPLRVCTKHALHGSIEPSKWKGDRWWVVALFEPVQWQDDKVGSLKRLIVEEIC